MSSVENQISVDLMYMGMEIDLFFHQYNNCKGCVNTPGDYTLFGNLRGLTQG